MRSCCDTHAQKQENPTAHHPTPRPPPPQALDTPAHLQPGRRRPGLMGAPAAAAARRRQRVWLPHDEVGGLHVAVQQPARVTRSHKGQDLTHHHRALALRQRAPRLAAGSVRNVPRKGKTLNPKRLNPKPKQHAGSLERGDKPDRRPLCVAAVDIRALCSDARAQQGQRGTWDGSWNGRSETFS
jgi:hypothetical protein